MKRISSKYKAKGNPNALPAMQAVDLALNVAACDNLPLVVVSGKDEKEISDIQQRLLPAIWSKSIPGQFVYSQTTDSLDLKPILGKKLRTGVLIVKPDDFGLSREK